VCDDGKFGSDFAHEEIGKETMRTGVSCKRERPGMMIKSLMMKRTARLEYLQIQISRPTHLATATRDPY
jgi:hypothetical protein